MRLPLSRKSYNLLQRQVIIGDLHRRNGFIAKGRYSGSSGTTARQGYSGYHGSRQKLRTAKDALCHAFARRGGFVKNTLVITLPGSPKGAAETMDALFPYVLHLFKVAEGMRHEGNKE